jgi:diketogulonate reductase-like aldo/keto reductase
VYGNEKIVGEELFAAMTRKVAYNTSTLPIAREDLFVASKLWNDDHAPADVAAACRRTLSDLQLDYLDLYLVHWPVPGKHVLAYKHLEELQAEGKLRSIGVSNYTVEDYQELMAHAVVTPAVNQIEVNPFLYRKQTIDFFQKEGVAVQAYRSLRQGKEMEHPTIAAIAAAHAGKSPAQPSSAQVLGAWALQKGLIYIPKSEKPERMLENAAVLDWELSEAEVAQLDGLTSEHTIAEFHALYCKCVVRDTPLAALDPAGKNPAQGVKTDITAG